MKIIKSIGLLNKNGIILKIKFYKKKGTGRIFIKNFFSRTFINSIKTIITLLKLKFIKIYRKMLLYDIFILINPVNYIIQGKSINLALFINFFCLIYNIYLSDKLIVVGYINNLGILKSSNNIKQKIFSLNLNNYIIISPIIIYDKLNTIYFKNSYNLSIIQIKNINQIFSLLNIKF